jgi:Tat protein secretion system quality control protein TatD with DNase activity
MFDEGEYEGAETLNVDQKAIHYRNVLTPKSEDVNFLRSLPDPRPFRHFLSQTKNYLTRYPLALVGEIGIDRSFRIPESWLPEQVEHRDDALTPGGREGRRLSPYRVNIAHQRKVLLAQLRLAGEMQRAVSVHGVQAHGIVYETFAESWKGHESIVVSKKERKRQESTAKLNAEPVDAPSDNEQLSGPKPYPPRICLHSYSGPAENVKQYTAPTVPCEVFFSFSTTINSWSDNGDGKVEAAVKAVPDESILVESDLHTAGKDMDCYLEGVVRTICKVKGWELEAGVKRLGQNWRAFVFGLR